MSDTQRRNRPSLWLLLGYFVAGIAGSIFALHSVDVSAAPLILVVALVLYLAEWYLTSRYRSKR